LRSDLFEGVEAFDEGLPRARVVSSDTVEQYQGADGSGEDEDQQSSEARVENEPGTQPARLYGWEIDDSFSLCEAQRLDKYCLDRMVDCPAKTHNATRGTHQREKKIDSKCYRRNRNVRIRFRLREKSGRG
jgi:hypothetical protein